MLCALSGCSTARRAKYWNWWYEKDKVGPQITSPYDRVEKLREFAKTGATMPEAEQQRLTTILLEDIQKEEDPAMRAEILHTLAALPNNTSLAVLKAALKDPNPLVRIAALDGWRRRGGGEAVPVLINMMNTDKELDVRMAAARELGELKDPAAVQALGAWLDDANPAVQFRAVQSLRNITGKDYGDDVTQWKLYVQGGNPQEVSIVSRLNPLSR
ncbi:MAG: HEAT repeat domain-containing protein [Planctomycetaceae bacterium]|nr:HEAT repeat domain-containing protein [Planctomycetaceae bacterium]